MVERVSGTADFIFKKLAAGKPDDLSLTQGPRRLDARKWFRQRASEVTSVDARRLMNKMPRDKIVTNINYNHIGAMYMFWYDAKLKKELPYWDMLPLIFPIEIYKDGFLGINLHYLPPMYRATLMDSLYDTMNNEKYDKTTRLRISYSIMRDVKKFKYFKPCIKRYLADHVQSNFMRIDPTEWDMALMLPTERFQKVRKETVWQESINKIRSR